RRICRQARRGSGWFSAGAPIGTPRPRLTIAHGSAFPYEAQTGRGIGCGRCRFQSIFRMPSPVDRKSTRLNSSHVSISYAVFCLIPRPRSSTLFPYTTLFRSTPYLLSGTARQRMVFSWGADRHAETSVDDRAWVSVPIRSADWTGNWVWNMPMSIDLPDAVAGRSEEHTSELQSRFDLVCRLLLDTSPS